MRELAIHWQTAGPGRWGFVAPALFAAVGTTTAGPARWWRRVLSRPAGAAAYLLALVPAVTDWIETGRLPSAPRDFLTELVLGVLVAAFVHRIHVEMRRVEAMARTDALTGLGNRRRFVDDLEREVAVARRVGSRLTLVVLDVDRFKEVNDLHGHAAGDEALRSAARWLAEAARRDTDRAYRVGGDEFALLMVGVDHDGGEALVRTAGRTAAGGDGLVLSFGVASLRAEDSVDSFAARADRAMYSAKQGSEDRKVSVMPGPAAGDST